MGFGSDCRNSHRLELVQNVRRDLNLVVVLPEGTSPGTGTTPEQLPMIVPNPYQPQPPPGPYGEEQTTENIEYQTVRPAAYGPSGESQRTTERGISSSPPTEQEITAERLRCKPEYVSLCEDIGNIILKVTH